MIAKFIVFSIQDFNVRFDSESFLRVYSDTYQQFKNNLYSHIVVTFDEKNKWTMAYFTPESIGDVKFPYETTVGFKIVDSDANESMAIVYDGSNFHEVWEHIHDMIVKEKADVVQFRLDTRSLYGFNLPAERLN